MFCKAHPRAGKIMEKLKELEELSWLISSWQVLLQYQGRSKRPGWSGFGWITISQGKNKIPFYKKPLRNKSNRVIFDLFSLLYYDIIDIKTYNEVENNRLLMHTKYFMLHKVFYCTKIK